MLQGRIIHHWPDPGDRWGIFDAFRKTVVSLSLFLFACLVICCSLVTLVPALVATDGGYSIMGIWPDHDDKPWQ